MPSKRFKAMEGSGVIVCDTRTGEQVCRALGANGNAKAHGDAVAEVLNAHADEYDQAVSRAD